MDSQQGLEVFHSFKVSKLALGPTQPHVQWILVALHPQIKQLGHKVEHLCVEPKNAWRYIPTPLYAFVGVRGGNFAFIHVSLLFYCYFVSQSMYIVLYKSSSTMDQSLSTNVLLCLVGLLCFSLRYLHFCPIDLH